MAEYFETLLPSGRAIRIERLYTREYREAQRRAGARAEKSAFNLTADLAHEMLLSSMRAVTMAPAELKFKGEGEAKEFDLDATLDAVPAAAWQSVSYESLITKGSTSIYELLKDINDYEYAVLFCQQIVSPPSPLGVMVAGKKRMRTSPAT